MPVSTSPIPALAMPGLPVVSEFRYPLWEATPIQPPEGVSLDGSSSDFITVAEGKNSPSGKIKEIQSYDRGVVSRILLFCRVIGVLAGQKAQGGLALG